MAKSNDASETGRPTQEQIAKRAYELFLQRGSVSGYELDDWLQAEAELTATAAKQDRQDRQDRSPRVEQDPSQEQENESDGHANGRRPSSRDRSPARRAVRP
jgi:hypothetical protein